MNIQSILTTNTGNNDAIFSDKQRAIKNYRLMQWAKWATFGLYIVAVFMLYVADIWGIGSFIEQKSNDWVALIVFSVIAFTLAFFLASSKEAVYEDIAIHRSEGYKLKASQIIAMGLFLSSGLLFEVFSTSNNQQHIANSAAENSAMFKAVEGSGVSLSNGSASLTKDLQAAQMRLADCQVKMEKAIAQGRKFDCAQSEANLAAVRESMSLSNQLAQQTNAQALEAKTESMLKVREHFDKPMFQAIGKATNTDNNTGMMIVIGVLIFVFECQHIMALFAYANALRRIKGTVGNVAQDQPRSTQDAYNVSPPLSALDSAKMSVAEYAQKVESGLKASPEILANEYARAQHGRNQQMEAMGNAAKAVGDKLESMSGKPDQAFMNEMLKSIKFQLLRSELEPTAESLYPAVYKTLYDAGYETPRKTVMKLAAHLLEHLATKDNVLVKHGNEYQLPPRWRSDAPVIQEVQGFKQSPEQAANVSKLYQEQMQEYNAGKLFNDESPTPEIKRQSVAETIRALVDAVKKSGAKTEADIQAEVFDAYAKLFNPADLDDGDLLKVAAKIAKSEVPATPSPAMPFQQRTGATGLHNPVLGTAEEHYPLPLTTSPELPKGSKGSTSPSTSPSFLKEAEGSATSPAASSSTSPELPKGSEFDQFYTLFKGHVQAGGKFSEPACFDLRKDSQFFSQLGKVKMNPIWNECLDRMAEEGILKPNSDYIEGSTYPRYKRAD